MPAPGDTDPNTSSVASVSDTAAGNPVDGVTTTPVAAGVTTTPADVGVTATNPAAATQTTATSGTGGTTGTPTPTGGAVTSIHVSGFVVGAGLLGLLAA